MSWENILKQNQKFEFFNDWLELEDLDEKYEENDTCNVKWELEIRVDDGGVEILFNIKELTIITDMSETESGVKEKIDSGKFTVDTSAVDFTQRVSPIYVEFYDGMFTVVFS
jgi:hypothetical protein